MSNLTHWKKLHNPDYLGAYALNPGQDLIATISTVGNEMVTGPDGKKEECMVMHFAERDVKPMIINSTNAKTITKLLKTPYIEEWSGGKIQIYTAEVKAFGEVVEALRIRPFLPKLESDKPIPCSECGKNIAAYGKMNPHQMAEYTQKQYGKALCSECAMKLAEAKKAEEAERDVL